MAVDFDKLREVFLSKDIDDEDYDDNYKALNDLEREYRESVDLQEWLGHVLTKKLFDTAQEAYVSNAVRLAQDRELTEKERWSIYAKQDAMLWLLTVVEDNPTEKISLIEEQVKKALGTT